MNTRKLPGRLHIVVLSVAMACFALPAHTADVGVTAGVGTLGAGLAFSFGVSERFNARLGYARYTDDREFEDSDLEFEGEVTVGGIFALADFFPFNGVFRLTGGLINNNNEVTGDAGVTDDVDIGDGTYDVGSLSANIEFESIAPYIGIGWDNTARGGRGFAASFDLGFMYQGGATVNLRAVGGDADLPSFEDDLRREEKNIEDDISADFYPVVALGLGWTF